MEKNRNPQSKKAYAAAGVDVDLGNRVKSGIQGAREGHARARNQHVPLLKHPREAATSPA